MFHNRTFCHKITHANDYYGVWPGRLVSVSVFPITKTEYMKAWRSLTLVYISVLVLFVVFFVCLFVFCLLASGELGKKNSEACGWLGSLDFTK